MVQCGVHFQLMGSNQQKNDSLLHLAIAGTHDVVVHLKRLNPELL